MNKPKLPLLYRLALWLSVDARTDRRSLEICRNSLRVYQETEQRLRDQLLQRSEDIQHLRNSVRAITHREIIARQYAAGAAQEKRQLRATIIALEADLTLWRKTAVKS